MSQTTMTRRISTPDGDQIERRRYRVSVVDQPELQASSYAQMTVGSAPGNDLVIDDSSVSRTHLRFESADDGVRVVDLGSTNGTTVHGIQIESALLKGTAELQLGDARLRFSMTENYDRMPLHPSEQFGKLWGASPIMRETFATLERAAKSDISVLLRGENGTGKELAAEALHDHSARRDGPFFVVDCSAMPASLIESELFGHARGAFTGAVADRAGAFELADGGTLFLDEIGELELTLQPRLLRALEAKEIKRVGDQAYRKIDVRVVAATNRDLQRMVVSGEFREDLYYRIAVLSVEMPALRTRGDDVVGLARRFWDEFARENARHGEPLPLSDEQLEVVRGRHWPGNVRQLRNFIERVQLLGFRSGSTVLVEEEEAPPEFLPELNQLPFSEARHRTLELFESSYMRALLERHNGNVAAAARGCGLNRRNVFRLIKRYDLPVDRYRKPRS